MFLKDPMPKKMISYNKLVRDKVPTIITENGERCRSRKAYDDQEYWKKLKQKLREEVEEFLNTEQIGELADVTEVLYAVCKHKQFDKNELLEIRKSKRAKRGGFDDRIILIEAEEI